MIIKRNIIVCILLSIITCGIYNLYWFIKLTDESQYASQDPNSASGGTALFFTIISCGIYQYFWAYKVGENLFNAREKRGLTPINNSVLYLLLSLFGLGYINFCLIQNELNALADS